MTDHAARPITEIEKEIENRLDEIRADPEALMRYDRNADGVIDGEEWEEVRRVVKMEVQTRRRRQEVPDASDANGEALEVLCERYELVREIGRGGQGHTYLARDTSRGELVAIKELAMRRVDSWKAIELFEREARTLESIDHPAIPDYVDSFHLESADGLRERFFLVQEFVDGESFDDLLAGGLRMNEADAREFLGEFLKILDYLHNLDPPVIHRDIKPSNIMRRIDGSLALIDFGAVQTILHEGDGGSSVVGTSGYMPLEQLMGRAVAATDLYALGATLVHFLSHRHPADLPVEYMRLRFQDYVNVSPALASFLERMLEPHAGDRFVSASDALESLAAPQDVAVQTATSSAVGRAPVVFWGVFLGVLTPIAGLMLFAGVAILATTATEVDSKPGDIGMALLIFLMGLGFAWLWVAILMVLIRAHKKRSGSL